MVDEVLLQFQDANLSSDEARKRIANEVCDRYYTDIEFTDEYAGTKEFVDNIIQQDELDEFDNLFGDK